MQSCAKGRELQRRRVKQPPCVSDRFTFRGLVVEKSSQGLMATGLPEPRRKEGPVIDKTSAGNGRERYIEIDYH